MKLLALAFFSVTALFAADDLVTGTWNIDGDVQGNPVKEVCSFTLADGKVTGSCKGDQGAYDVTGELAGMKFVFRHGGEYQGDKLTLTYSGTIDDMGVLKGTLDVQPMDVSGDFTAKRDQPAK
jgi:hypothetical protein